jgi:cephalosporin hydroxylase
MRPSFTLREFILISALVAIGGLMFFDRLVERPAPAASVQNALQSEQKIIESFHKLYYESLVWDKNRWLGVRCQQNPNDAWIHQEIIADVKPDFIIETGTLNGGSAALWATILQQVNPKGRIITIDIKDEASEAKKLPIVKQYVDFIIGSSTDPAILYQVKKRVEGRKVLVILDSDHSKDHVLAEMKAYGPLVSAGSYLIVQDTNINGHPVLPNFGPGPMEAVQEFLASNQQFKSDINAERLMLTLHPKGYLKPVS